MSRQERPQTIPIQARWDNVIAADVPSDIPSKSGDRIYAMVNPEDFPLLTRFSSDGKSRLPARTDVRYASLAIIKGLAYVAAGKIVSEVTPGHYLDYVALAAGSGLGFYMAGTHYDKLHDADVDEQVSNFNQLVRDGTVVSSAQTNYYLHPQYSDELRTRQLTVGDEGIKVSANDVAAWLEPSDNENGPFFISDDHKSFGVSYHAPTAVARMDTSLFKEYASYQESLGADAGLSQEDKLRARSVRFTEHADGFAAEIGLPLHPARLQLAAPVKKGGVLGRLSSAIERGRNELLGVEPEHVGLQDVDFSLVSIKPKAMLEDSLANDPQPGLVFAQAQASLDGMRRIRAERDVIKERIASLTEVGELTGTVSMIHSNEIITLKTDYNGLLIDEAAAALAFAGTLIVRKRQLAFKEQQKELLDAMSDSPGYTDQEGALDLYDIAVSALASRADPTDSGAITQNKDITEYLAAASRLSDGTDETRRRLYDGMRSQFPALKLPERPSFDS